MAKLPPKKPLHEPLPELPARGLGGKTAWKSHRMFRRNGGSSGMQSPGPLKYIGFLLSFFIGNDPFDTFT